MMVICLFSMIFVIVAAISLRDRVKAKALVSRYKGQVSILGDAIRFGYAGLNFQLRKLASNGGLAGTGYFCALQLELDDSAPLVIAPRGAMKYIYVGAVPDEHTVLDAPSLNLLVVAHDHQALAQKLSEEGVSESLGRLFIKHYSLIQSRRETNLSLTGGIEHKWTLTLTGIPAEVYTSPDTLMPILDDFLRVTGAIAHARN
jgi:hypothetical protein